LDGADACSAYHWVAWDITAKKACCGLGEDTLYSLSILAKLEEHGQEMRRDLRTAAGSSAVSLQRGQQEVPGQENVASTLVASRRCGGALGLGDASSEELLSSHL